MIDAVTEIIIPVHNSLSVVRPCFGSVLRWTDLRQTRITLVNDASDQRTSSELRAWASRHQGVDLLENSRNIGFVRTCNRALMASKAEYVVILNSDTCVTPRWLGKMVACMESDGRIAMASPITNFAPHMRVDMVPGFGYIEMNALIERYSKREYPDITTPEGFCLILRRACLAVIGYFDPVFGDGYGEESDLAMRANYFGYRTVLVDDTFIYHRGRASFGATKREQLYQANKVIFHDRWGNKYPSEFSDFLRRDPLRGIRHAIAAGKPEHYRSAFRR